MKLGPVTEIYKRNTARSKNLMNFWKVVTSLSFFRCVVNLEQYGSLTFLLIVTFYLTKTENITKKYVTQLSYFALNKGTIFATKC